MRKEKWEENNQKGADHVICLMLPHVQDTIIFFPVVIYFSSLTITSIHSLPSFYPSVYLALCFVMSHTPSVTVPSTVHC